MRKRIIALLLALVMALGLVMPASATGVDGATIGGDGAPVVITGDGVTTTPPADTDTPTPVDGEDDGDESDTPAPVDTPAPTSLLGAAPLGAAAPVALAATSTASSVEYLDKDGNKQTCTTATEVENITNTLTGGESAENPRWYVVNKNMKINRAVTVSGNVNLILCDGATLTVDVEDLSNTDGITISSGASLTIYQQPAGESTTPGALTVEGGSYNVAINIPSGGSITVNGGTITTKGKPAIRVAGTMTVNSGMVTASCINGSGILVTGGTETITGGTLTINGGTVKAEGSMAAGISLNENDAGTAYVGTLNFNGGTLCGENTAAAISSYAFPGIQANNAAAFNRPEDFWWRNAKDGAYSRNKVTAYVGGAYQELTTIKPDSYTAKEVKYMDWVDGALKEKTYEDPIKITDQTEWGAKDKTTWYYVEDSMAISNTVKVKGDVRLILCDDATLEVTTSSSYASGIQIDGGNSGNDAKLTIYGQSGQTGALISKATGSAYHGINITNNGQLTINGGNVTATGNTNNTCSGINFNGSGALTINSGNVTATGSSFGIWENGGSVTFNGGTLIAMRSGDGDRKAAIAKDEYAPLNLPSTYWWRTAESGDGAKYKTQEWAYTNDDLTGTYFEVTTTPQSDVALNPPVDYLDWDGSKLVAKTGDKGIADYTVVSADSCDTDGSITLTGGTGANSPKWYAVKRDVTITGKLTITGHVNLILCNGAKLTVNKGIVGGSNNESLTIYGQPEETGKAPGKLEATGVSVTNNNSTDDGTGINISTLTINGGEITATGGAVAKDRGNSYGVDSASLTINGGLLTATGGDATNNGTSIGANVPLALTVNGGELKATGGIAETSVGIGSMEGVAYMTVNGGKVTGIGADGASASTGIMAGIMSVNEPSSPERGIQNPEDGSSAAAPEVTGIGGNTPGGTSIGIFAVSMAVDGVNALGDITITGIDLPGGNTATGGTVTGTTTGSTCSAKITATGGTVSVAEDEGNTSVNGTSDGVSCGMLVMLLQVGLSDDDIEDIMGNFSGSNLGMLGEGDEEEPNGDEDTPADTTGSTAQINATGANYGIRVWDVFGWAGVPMPAVWLNGGTLTATGAVSGIEVLDFLDIMSPDTFGLDVFGLDTFGIDTYGNEEETGDAPTRATVYVRKGTLIAEGTGTGGKGLDLGDPVNSEVPLRCPTEYWWRISKSVGYTKYPGMAAYSYTGEHNYVEITSNGAGLPLLPEPEETPLPEPEETPLPEPEGSKHQPIRRQKNAVAALVPTKPEKVDVASPETFDAGIALYVGLGVLSLTGSAAWVGKRKKW